MSNLTGGDVCEILPITSASGEHVADRHQKFVGLIVVLTTIHEDCSANRFHPKTDLCPHWRWAGSGRVTASWQVLRKLPPPADLVTTTTEETADV
jgi:hypothetical protein